MLVLFQVIGVVRVVGNVCIFHDMVRMLIILVLHINVFNSVKAEPVQTKTHPIQRHVQNRVAYRLIIKVQFRHS